MRTLARRPMALPTLLALVACVLLMTPTASAQVDARSHFEDFIHYTKIARPDLAAASAQELLDSGLSDAELAETLDGAGRQMVEDFDDAAIRAQFIPELEPWSSELARRVEDGRLDLARDPARIEAAIQGLTGLEREKLLSRDRLLAAGEYAVPALMRMLVTEDDEVLKAACRNMLIRIGRVAVTPICIALPYLDPVNQRTMCEALSEIGYGHAIPYLLDLAADSATSEPVETAARRAAAQLGARPAELTAHYAALARRYFDGEVSLIAYPAEPTNNVWEHDPTIVLRPITVPTTIFDEIMAVRTSTRAVELDETNRAALSLFVASNLRRENEVPAGMTDPIYGDLDYSPGFYATVFGTSVCLDVLALALDQQDTPLIRDAIDALADVTGGANLFASAGSSFGGRQPLVEALFYPDRRTAYDAALVLGRALPEQPFERDHAVVTTLASALRVDARSSAAILAENFEDVNVFAGRLEGLGFDVLATGRGVGDVRSQIERSPAIDLVVIRSGSADDAAARIEGIRNLARTAPTPILVVMDGNERGVLERRYPTDAKLRVITARVDDQGFQASVDNLLERAAGGRMDEIDRAEYATAAIEALRLIGLTRGTVFDLTTAEPDLIDAFRSSSGGMQVFIADVLALVPTSSSQQALFDVALEADDRDQAALLERVAESARRHGDLSERRQVTALIDLIEMSDGAVAEAAAKVHGALNLPGNAALELIPR